MEYRPARTADGRPAMPPGVLPLEVDDPVAIGGHRLVARLGSGGMGVVYLGRDDLGRLVAVKTAPPDVAADADVRSRFRSEVACARKAPPACTARVLLDGTAETPPYIVTEYVDGPSLAQVVDTDGPLPPDRLRELAMGVAWALAAIHEAGLVHRDLKPANVLLTAGGPRVIDFGIAQQVPASGGLTKAGVVMGSPGWIAPERLAGRPATAASDVFGWGCLVVYAATGKNPFGRGDGDELARRVMHEPPDLTGLDEPIRGLAAAALAKEPEERPGAAELVEWLDGGIVPAAGRPPRRIARSLTSAALAVAAAAAALLVAAAVDHDAAPAPPGGEAVLPPSHQTPPNRRPSSAPAIWPPADAPRGTGGPRTTGPPGGATGTPAGAPPGTGPTRTKAPTAPPTAPTGRVEHPRPTTGRTTPSTGRENGKGGPPERG